MSRLANTIEAILYLKAQPLKIAQIAEFAKCDKESAEEGLIELMGEYAHRESALEIAETEEGYALQLREVYKPLVNSIVPLDIGLGALRTLAAIALRGPIAQNELVDLRGSGVYQHVPDLVEQGFVKKRKQSDGRSSWLQITEKFYQHFEIDKLPQISNLTLPTPIASAKAKDGEIAPSAIGDEDTDDEGRVEAAAVTDNAPETASVEDAAQKTSQAATANPAGEADEPQAATPNDERIDENIAEEIAILSGNKPPSSDNAPLSDAAIEAAAEETQPPAIEPTKATSEAEKAAAPEV